MVPAPAAARPGGERPHSRLTSGPTIVLYLALAKLLLHLFTAARYGIFREEMYYAAFSRHLAWSYVDHPSMNVFIAWFARHVFGDSRLGLRLLPAIAGAALVWMAGQLAREMGGGRFALLKPITQEFEGGPSRPRRPALIAPSLDLTFQGLGEGKLGH